MAKRILDIFLSFPGILLLSPLFLFISLLIILDSRGGVIYRSRRVGRYQKPFEVFKFRTMYPNKDNLKLTIGERDPRITRAGYYLRKYKLDELPQLFNVLRGEMSIVGPRPDVPEYCDYYLGLMPGYYYMKPGITCYSSIYFSNESELYRESEDPKRLYINHVIPKKVELDRKYFARQGVFTDISIIFKTLEKIFINR
jgi:lipopolysaccharide/colanic/teichoic acid biosynthesis glycosyltransferase